MFTDRVKIFVKGGDGGAGALSFRREKYVPRGGPDGGNGGRGGSVILEVRGDHSSLQEYRHRHHFVAQAGGRGGGNHRQGRRGEDLRLPVPPGTLVLDEDGSPLGDLVRLGQRLTVAPGGRGGRGNASFRGPTRQAPRLAELGEPAVGRWLTLELKLIADVGLVGLPNAGKSTLLAAASAARPKIADYPFTTVEPVLGVVQVRGSASFVMADLPGLIQGAHQGAGLGLEFLRHIERTRVLINVVDASTGTVDRLWEDYQQVRRELSAYRTDLARRPHLVALNKIDALSDPNVAEAFLGRLKQARRRGFLVSALTGQGVPELMSAAWQTLKRRPTVEAPAGPGLKLYRAVDREPIRIEVREDGFHVFSDEVERLAAMTDMTNPEALARFQRQLDRLGLNEALAGQGARGGETVHIHDLEFIYDPEH
jgi:GTP-binding protein